MTRLSVNLTSFDKSMSPMKLSYDIREFTNEQLLEAKTRLIDDFEDDSDEKEDQDSDDEENKEEDHTKVGSEPLEFSDDFYWNLGTIITVLMLIYQSMQFALFAANTINDGDDGEDDTEDTSTATESSSWKSTITSIVYIDIEFETDFLFEIYSLIGIGCVFLLLLTFMFVFLRELKNYGIIKYFKKDQTAANEYFFHSFVGTIIYGHGTLQDVPKIVSLIVRLICDSFFLVVCEKLVLVLACNRDGTSIIDNDTICWEGNHLVLASAALVCLAFYIPFCVMVAPMFMELDDEDGEDEDEEEKEQEQGKSKKKNKEDFDENRKQKKKKKKKKRKFWSVGSTVGFIKPYLSFVTVAECFMVIGANFMFQGDAMGVIGVQVFVCFLLLFITATWSYKDMQGKAIANQERIDASIEANLLNLQEATHKDSLLPVYPYGIAMLKCFTFFVGIVGCIIELLFYSGILTISNTKWFDNKIVDNNLDFILIIVLSLFGAFITYSWYSCQFRKKHFDLVYPTKNSRVIEWKKEMETAIQKQNESILNIISKKSEKLISKTVQIYDPNENRDRESLDSNEMDEEDDISVDETQCLLSLSPRGGVSNSQMLQPMNFNENMYRLIEINDEEMSESIQSKRKWILFDINNHHWSVESN